MSLPGADELFRATIADDEAPAPTEASTQLAQARQPSQAPQAAPAESAVGPSRRASGRVRHDEKMTVYVTADELLALEQARLTLRRSLGSAVDRGRLVRAAVAMALADLDANGDDSDLARRLSGT